MWLSRSASHRRRPRAPWRVCVRAFLARPADCLRNPDAVEFQLGGVRGPAAEFVELAHQLQARGAARDDEQRLATVTEFFVDDRVDHVYVGDAAVADPHLVAVEYPVTAVALGRGPQIADIAAAFGLGDRQRRELEVTRRAEALRRPLQHLLGGGRLADRRERQRRHHDRQTDSGATPEQLFHEHRQRKPGRVADQIAIEQRTVEAALGGLFQHRPRELLLLVVVQGDRPDDRFGELVGAPGQVVLCAQSASGRRS